MEIDVVARKSARNLQSIFGGSQIPSSDIFEKNHRQNAKRKDRDRTFDDYFETFQTDTASSVDDANGHPPTTQKE
jgi:hypothetical protein